MRHSSAKLATGLAAFVASMLSGCQTVTDDKLLFVTDTKVALDVSGDPTGQSSFTLGYKRKEAILLPLASGAAGMPTHLCVKSGATLYCEAVADQPNRGSHVCVDAKDPSKANAVSDNKKLLCDTTANVRGNLYAASVDGPRTIDAYSVMASFGLDSSFGGAKVAQFIATGIAAQNLTKKEVSSLINPNATTPNESQIKIASRQVSNMDKISKNVLVDGKVDKTKLETLLNKSTLAQSSKDQIKTFAGQTEEAFKKSLGEGFPSNIEELASLATEA